MEVCCSFKAIVGNECSFDSRDRYKNLNVIPLLSCRKDITNHLSLFSFSGVESEIDLILARSSIFKRPKNIETMTICPFHRSKLGLGWTRGAATRCRVPQELSLHGKSTGSKSWSKGDRGLGKKECQMLLRKTGAFRS